MSFFPGEAMSPDMQCFKDVVSTQGKLLYRKVTFFPGEAKYVAGHAVLQGCGTYQR